MQQFAEMLQAYAGNVWLYGGTFLLVLSVLVFVHEWGHFIVARMCGVRVDVFSIGFGREIWGWSDPKTGTRWRFSMIPLGGYVKMFGDKDPASAGYQDSVEMEDGSVRSLTEAERAVVFYKKKIWQRAAIVFAGPAINFIFAVVLLAFLYGNVGMVSVPPVIGAVEVDGAADRHGLMPHDRFISIDGREIKDFNDVAQQVAMALDQEMDVVIERDGKQISLGVTPELKIEEYKNFENSRGFLGVLGPVDGLLLSHIIAVNGESVDAKDSEQARVLLLSLLERGDETVSVRLERKIGFEQDLRVRPLLALNDNLKEPNDKGHVLMIMEPVEDVLIEMNAFQAVQMASLKTYTMAADTLRALGQIVTGVRSVKELGGVIRIAAVAGDMAERSFIAVVIFAAMLSVNLGIINLLPIPMLDGGHLMFYLFEAIKGKPMSDQFQEYAFRFGFIMLVGLMLFTNLNDIVQLFIL